MLFRSIRLWNDPYSEDGKPYSAGTSDFTKLVALASAGKKLGYSYLLDLHYSDFWADPGKQFPPKEWAYAGADALEKHVYDYTKDVLLKLKRLDLLPEMESAVRWNCRPISVSMRLGRDSSNVR